MTAAMPDFATAATANAVITLTMRFNFCVGFLARPPLFAASSQFASASHAG